MNKQKQKEQLPLRIAKTVLAIAIITGLGTIIFGGGVVIMKYYNGEVNDKPFKQLPALCKNNFDCPLQMKCENFICVDVGCIKEGGSFPPPISPKYTNHMATKCCEDLKRITASKYYDGDCNIQMYPVGGSISICSNCGNGICEENLETKCNCPEDCGEQSDTSDWQTYRNEEFGFEVKYPSDWEAIENGENGGVLFFDNPFYANEYESSEGPEFEDKYGDYAFISIGRYPEGARTAAGTVTKDTKIKDFVYKLYPKDRFVSEEIIIGGQKAYMFGYMPMVYLKQKNDIVTISMWSGPEHTDHKKLSATFRQILSTFKFIES